MIQFINDNINIISTIGVVVTIVVTIVYRNKNATLSKGDKEKGQLSLISNENKEKVYHEDESKININITNQNNANGEYLNTDIVSEKGGAKSNGDLQKSNDSYREREVLIGELKKRTYILFIDDDENFAVVNIFKQSGWKNTKTVIDIKTLETLQVKEADIIFIDINGVGKLLECKNEGLDIALMLKQRYPQKKIVIYSADRKHDYFHEAWDLCDYKLEKNALPSEFLNLIENFCIEIDGRR